MKFSAPEATSIAGGILSIFSALTLNQVGVIAGIVTALLTCWANLVYMSRRDRREEREFLARIEKLGGMK